ncbi:MAG: Ig-like domain-containing protein [Oscillospiraceae bacterium]|nr:Ig-like domain-containing protein [Oscillospiraceae bacterium]
MSFSERLENSQLLRTWLMRGVVIFLVLTFLGGIAWGASDLLTREGTDPPAMEPDESVTNPPKSDAEIYAYIQNAINMALEKRPKLVTGSSFGLDGGSVSFSAPDADTAPAERLKAALLMLAPDLTGHLKNALPHDETQYGDDLSGLLPKIDIDPAALESAECDFIYYRCSVCGRSDSEPLNQCPNCDSEQEPDEPPLYELRYRDNYTLTLYFADGSPALENVFAPLSQDEIMAMLDGQLDGYADVDGIRTVYRNARIIASVNRLTKKPVSLEFKKDIDVELLLRVNPELEDLTTTLTCVLSESRSYRFTWPGLALNEYDLTLGKRQSVQITAAISAPDGQDTPLTWQSSDPSICEIDQDGYVKTGREFGEAVITASFELHGETYAAECAVHVKIPVEKAKLDSRRLKMNAGETKQLTVNLSPRDATYQEVVWKTENAAIASVDENGVVTALSAGKTTVYAVTNDGYHKASCAVEVGGVS